MSKTERLVSMDVYCSEGILQKVYLMVSSSIDEGCPWCC